ncbi:MAG TPA: FtsQ-type POTRA domain-containing protein [Candidatus Methylacidiphilales bacterium]
MSRRLRNRTRQKQINILHTTTRKRHSRKQVTQAGIWCAIVLAMIVGVGVGLHFGINFLLDRVLYTNPLYTLSKIEIDPANISPRQIRQAAGLEPGENLWTLNLAQIGHDLEKLPYVSSAKVERHFPDKVVIHITERVPVVKIVGLNIDLGTRETFYLDRDCIVLKPRENETLPLLPEVIGLTNAELEPGAQVDEENLRRALKILDAMDHSSLHTSIDIRSIALSQPLSITMVTTTDMSVTFHLDYIDTQMFRLKQIIDYATNLQRTLHTIDLTPDCNVPVTFYE